ncbi:MAG: hypothetical protein KAU28_01230 [Phycisphaerae bacterium]|nr:hypothetical protein [Phycisphaerae bacterium]
MSGIAFQTYSRMAKSTLTTIETAAAVIREYQAQGYVLTLRQLYYQFVARDLSENTQRAYSRLGRIISEARLYGLLDWDALEDRTRNLETINAWDSPRAIIEASAEQYQRDLWVNQPAYVEVWVEKEALLGVIARTCTDLRVPHFACRGYVSQSEMFNAGYHRLRRALANDRRCIIIHLGDHDPSGVDMTRDIHDRLELFAGDTITVNRIALNWDQVEEYKPPPNPAKQTDSRCAQYMAQFGDEGWELDALEPAVLDRLIREAVLEHVDQDAWQEQADREETDRRTLARIVTSLPDGD